MFAETDIDAASELEASEREAAITRIRGALSGEGADDCVGCGEPIPPARRAALPSAERCVGCQALLERGRR